MCIVSLWNTFEEIRTNNNNNFRPELPWESLYKPYHPQQQWLLVCLSEHYRNHVRIYPRFRHFSLFVQWNTSAFGFSGFAGKIIKSGERSHRANRAHRVLSDASLHLFVCHRERAPGVELAKKWHVKWNDSFAVWQQMGKGKRRRKGAAPRCSAQAHAHMCVVVLY